MSIHTEVMPQQDEVTRPTVSLIMPLLNAMPYLHEALECLGRQGLDNLEVIAVDAGSTDGTREALEQVGFIKVVDAPGTSQTAALNLGFAMATGDIFGWLNGDDFLSDGTLGWVADWFATRRHVQMLYGDSMAINETGRRYGVRSNVRAGQYGQLLHGDFIVQPSAFWRREVFFEVGKLDESLHYAFDYAFFLEVARCHELTYVPLVLSFERLRGGAKTSNGGEPRAQELLTVMQNHDRNAVPMAFKPEVSSVHALAALREIRSGDRPKGWDLLKKALSEGRPRLFTWAHLLAYIIGGPRGTAEARLVSNWLRTTKARRKPLWPSGLPQGFETSNSLR